MFVVYQIRCIIYIDSICNTYIYIFTYIHLHLFTYIYTYIIYPLLADASRSGQPKSHWMLLPMPPTRGSVAKTCAICFGGAMTAQLELSIVAGRGMGMLNYPLTIKLSSTRWQSLTIIEPSLINRSLNRSGLLMIWINDG